MSGSYRPRLLVTDMVMPGMNGAVLAQRLLDQDPSLAVLFVSGYTEDQIARGGPLPPGSAFLAKPFTGGEPREKVAGVLARETAG